MQSTDFGAFMERSSRMIEQAMAEPSGLFFDLMMGDGEMARWVWGLLDGSFYAAM